MTAKHQKKLGKLEKIADDLLATSMVLKNSVAALRQEMAGGGAPAPSTRVDQVINRRRIEKQKP